MTEEKTMLRLELDLTQEELLKALKALSDAEVDYELVRVEDSVEATEETAGTGYPWTYPWYPSYPGTADPSLFWQWNAPTVTSGTLTVSDDNDEFYYSNDTVTIVDISTIIGDVSTVTTVTTDNVEDMELEEPSVTSTTPYEQQSWSGFTHVSPWLQRH